MHFKSSLREICRAPGKGRPRKYDEKIRYQSLNQKHCTLLEENSKSENISCYRIFKSSKKKNQPCDCL